MVNPEPVPVAVRFAVLPEPDVDVSTPDPPVTVQVTIDASNVFSEKVPEPVKAVGPLTVGTAKLVVLPLMPVGSSQLLRRVLLVPPPVQDVNKRPYWSGSSCADAGVQNDEPPSSWPTTRRDVPSNSGEPDEPPSVTPLFQLSCRNEVPAPGM